MGIKKVEDQWVEDMEGIVNVALNYFDNLFKVGSKFIEQKHYAEKINT